MKPRLRAAPWTKEDSDILWRLIVRGRWARQGRTPLDYRDTDNRDALIMLGREVHIQQANRGRIRYWRPAQYWVPPADDWQGDTHGLFEPRWFYTGNL